MKEKTIVFDSEISVQDFYRAFYRHIELLPLPQTKGDTAIIGTEKYIRMAPLRSAIIIPNSIDADSAILICGIRSKENSQTKTEKPRFLMQKYGHPIY